MNWSSLSTGGLQSVLISMGYRPTESKGEGKLHYNYTTMYIHSLCMTYNVHAYKPYILYSLGSRASLSNGSINGACIGSPGSQQTLWPSEFNWAFTARYQIEPLAHVSSKRTKWSINQWSSAHYRVIPSRLSQSSPLNKMEPSPDRASHTPTLPQWSQTFSSSLNGARAPFAITHWSHAFPHPLYRMEPDPSASTKWRHPPPPPPFVLNAYFIYYFPSLYLLHAWEF